MVRLGQHRLTARLAKVGAKGKWQPEPRRNRAGKQASARIFRYPAPTVNNPKELATRMAALAQLIRNTISLTFKSEEGAGSLHTQMEGFRQVLLPES